MQQHATSELDEERMCAKYIVVGNSVDDRAKQNLLNKAAAFCIFFLEKLMSILYFTLSR